MSGLSEAERTARLQLARTERIGPVAFLELIRREGDAVTALERLPELVRRSGASLNPAPQARIDDDPTLAVPKRPQVDVIQRHRQRRTQPQHAVGDIESVPGIRYRCEGVGQLSAFPFRFVRFRHRHGQVAAPFAVEWIRHRRVSASKSAAG